MKKVILIATSVALAVMSVIPATAATLTNITPGGSTEVDAQIVVEPGEVTYEITIPDKVDFGQLSQPQTDTNSYRDVNYTVTAEKIEGLEANQGVVIRVKDQNATVDDDQFYITNKTDNTKKLNYDVFATDTPDTDTAINAGEMSDKGYLLCSFDTAGQSLEGTLRLNQRQLFGKDLNEYKGDYTGYMTFYSTISTLPY